jgi:hypothetical protein
MWQIAAAPSAPLTHLELLPKALPWVQLRRLGRQALEGETVRRAVRENLPDGGVAGDRRPIPDDEHPAGPLAPEGLAQPDHRGSVASAVLAADVPLAFPRDGPARRQMGAGAPLLHDRDVAHRRIGADDPGQGIKARFVSQEDRLPLGLRPCLRAGQVASRHWTIAASAHGRARRTGCCGLHRSTWHERPT